MLMRVFTTSALLCAIAVVQGQGVLHGSALAAAEAVFGPIHQPVSFVPSGGGGHQGRFFGPDSGLSRGFGNYFGGPHAGPIRHKQPADYSFPVSQPLGAYHGQSTFGFDDFFKGSPVINLGQCGPQAPGVCNKSKYRSADGSCNNLKNPTWGMAMTTYNRVKPPKYADGVQEPPRSVTGKELPPARLVSAVLFPDADVPDPKWTLAAMQWGQIMTHDMSMAAGTTQAKAHATQCCNPDGTLIPKEYTGPTCFPIVIGHDDPVYGKAGQSCMNFVRSTTDVSQGCTNGYKPAEQLTAVTSFLDLSLVYGSDQQTAGALRAFHKGLLRADFRRGKPYPPSAPNKTAACDHLAEHEPCYFAGDLRVNQNPQLTVLQIILLREHNRIVSILSKINPHWDDEKLYQEGRRINIAQHQHISYYEWLPIFLGQESSRRHGLIYDTHGYTDDYREDVDPSVLNGHATAAFRYFHSNIAGFLKLVNEHRESYSALRLSDHFNRPQVIEEGDNYDQLIRGMATQSQQAVDQFFTTEITNYLFRNGKQLGQDLRAIDVQRGRDHGLASYNDYRHFCGLSRAHHFSDFSDLISQENIQKLASLYAHPDDVDFTIGGSLEAHIEGTLSGPTFLCVMVEQFYRTRVGDRYFFENGEKHHSLNPGQLAEIRKASISRLFCDNGDHIYAMQPKGFLKISHENFVVPCHRYDAIPAINLELWRDTHQHQDIYKK